MANEFPVYNGLLQSDLAAGGFTLTNLGSLTLGSTSTFLALHNVADQVTNFEKATFGWSSNVFKLALSAGGTGTARNFELLTTNAVSSGTPSLISFLPTVAQSGTAGYTALKLNVTESSTGSGARLLLDMQVGGVSRFQFATSGNLTVGNASSTAEQAVTFVQGGNTLGSTFASTSWLAKDSAGNPTFYTGLKHIILDPTFPLQKGQLDLQTAHTTGLTTNLRLSGNAWTGLPSGQSLHFYNTTDETTDLERAILRWSSNVFELLTDKAGTGTGRTMKFTVAGNAASSGTANLFHFAPTVAQSGTAAYTGLYLNVTETSTGSGIKALFSAAIGGTAKFAALSSGHLANTGSAYFGTTDATAPTLLNSFVSIVAAQPPTLWWNNTSGATDMKLWSIKASSGGILQFLSLADDTTTSDPFLAAIKVSDYTIDRVVFPSGNIGVGFNLVDTPSAKLHVKEPTLGNAVFITETATSADPVNCRLVYGRVATTDATVTAIVTVALTASRTYYLVARVYARRTGGTAGTAEDAAGYSVRGVFKTVAGSAVLVDTLDTDLVAEDVAGYNATMAVTGTNVEVRVTGVVDTNITWHAQVEISYVGS